MNLFGTLWTRDKTWIDKYIVNHERIHTRQQIEMLVIPFYLIYILEWLVRLLQYRNFRKAYYNISFEREAYDNGDNLNYLKKRKAYFWMRYIFRKSHQD